MVLSLTESKALDFDCSDISFHGLLLSYDAHCRILTPGSKKSFKISDSSTAKTCSSGSIYDFVMGNPSMALVKLKISIIFF